MHCSTEEIHLYTREPIDPSGKDSLATIARMIRSGSTVLDVGCSTGELGRYLTNTKDCLVDGLDQNSLALATAKAHYRRVMLVDLDHDGIDDLVGEERYDFIVCADVLEHLLVPGQLLEQLTDHLVDDGQIIFSVPNVTYIGVIVELLFGNFCYRDDGILDRTHLHFFTKESFRDLLHQHCLTVDSAVDIPLDLAYSEFSQYLLSDLSHEELTPLLDRPDALTYQFVVAAKIAHGYSSDEPSWIDTTYEPSHLELGCSWKNVGDDAFQTSNRMVQQIRFGVESELLRFDIESASTETMLALDTASQPGYLGVLEIALWHDELLLWQQSYTGDRSLATPDPSLLDARHSRAELSSLASILTARDERIELPIPPSILESATVLEVTISWCTLREYLLRLRNDIVRLEHHNNDLWSQIAGTSEDSTPNGVARRELRHAKEHQRYEVLRHYLDTQRLKATLAATETRHRDELSSLAHLQDQLREQNRLLTERDRLVADLYASTSWRLTEPLRRLGAQIPQPLRRLLSLLLHYGRPGDKGTAELADVATQIADDVPVLDPVKDQANTDLISGHLDLRVKDIYAPALLSQQPLVRTREREGLGHPFDFPIALVIDAIWPEPDRDAGSLLANNQLETLKKLGYQVVFIPLVGPRDSTKYREALVRDDILCPTGELVDSLEDFIANYGNLLTLIVLSRVDCGGRYYEQIRQHAPQAKIVYNPIDLHGVRELRAGELIGDHKSMQHARALLERELYLARNTEATLVVSTTERQLLQNRLPDVSVYTSPVATHQERRVPSYEERNHIIGFIGNCGHLPNVDAVEVLVHEIWPPLSAREPGLRLQIVGQSLPQTICDTLPYGVEYVGHVDDIEAWLATIKATVAPLRFGAGAKGKIVTSLSNGVPCVASEIGVEGMGLIPDQEVVIAHKIDDFVDRLSALVNDRTAWECLSQAALARMRADYNPGVALAVWYEMLSDIGAPCDLGRMDG